VSQAKTEARGQRSRGRVYLLANALLLLAVAFMANYLAFRHYARWDWTDESVYTLSDRTTAVLRGLSAPVSIYVLLSRNEPEQAEVRNLLERYRAISDKLEVRYLDPFRDPGGYEAIVRRFELPEVPPEEQAEGVVPLANVAVVVASGDKHWEIRRDDLVRRSYGEETGDLVELDVEAERAMTGAIVEVTAGEPTRLCIATGHGERPMEGGGGTLGGLVDELRHENVESEELEVRARTEIPVRSGGEGCDALLVVDPELPWEESAQAQLRSYLRRGGNVLMAFEPVGPRTEDRVRETGFEDFLSEHGISVGRDVVIELSEQHVPANGGHPVILYLVNEFGEHPLTERIRTMHPDLRMVAVSQARSVTPSDDRAQTLLSTTEHSYGESDLGAFASGEVGEPGADDVRGPVSLGVATQIEPEEEGEEAHGGRLVVLGDASLLTSELMGGTNASFAQAIVGWLTQRRALIHIAPRTIDRPAAPSVGEEWMLFFRVVVLIPLAFVFLGFAVWWNRRH
jgi:hypothetical protein